MSSTIKFYQLLLATILMVADCVNGSFVQDLTVEAGDLVRTCLGRSPVARWDCVKNESLAVVYNFSLAPRITLLDGIRLVRVTEPSEGIIDTKKPSPFDYDIPEKDGATWSRSVLSALRRLLDTHVLEIGLPLPEGPGSRTVLAVRFGDQHLLPVTSNSEGRHRRRQQMIPMMIFGVTVFGMFIVPIAFQFLTALSGKAFLMAKLALLLASINGLKRVASAGVHYGLYHAVDHYPVPAQHPPPPFHQHPHLGPGPLLYDRAESGLYAEGPRDDTGSSVLTPLLSHFVSKLSR